MLATSTPFQTMVEGTDQTVEFRLQISLPGGIYPAATLAVSKLSIDASTTTDLPAGTRLEAGYPAVQASFTLTGMVDPTDESKTAEWLFGRYQTTSPLYLKDAFRCPVTIDIGLYPAGAVGVPELLRKFTGYVDEYVEDTEGGIAFTCIDLRSNLRNVPDIPAVVTAPPYNAGLTAEFAVDALLRKATAGTVSSWPATRSQAVLSVGLRSSLWPEVGTLNTANNQPTPAFLPGPYGTGLCNYNVGLGPLGTVVWNVSGLTNTIYLEAFVSGADADTGSIDAGKLRTSAGSGITTLRGISVIIESTGIRLQLDATQVAAITTTMTAAPHLVAAQVKYVGTSTAGTFSGTLWLDGTAQTFSVALRDNEQYSFAAPSNVVLAGLGLGDPGLISFAGFQVTAEATPTPNVGFVPAAVLDSSLNKLQVIPAMSGDPWLTIQQIAAVELAVAGFDESGVFRFKNRNTLAGAAVARTITSTTSLKGLSISSTAAAVVNRAQIGFTSWSFATTKSAVYNLDTVKAVPPGGLTINAVLDNLAVSVDSTAALLPNGNTDVTNSFYRASDDQAGLTTHPTAVTVTVTQPAPDKLTIFIPNTGSQPFWLVSPAAYTDVTVGTPVLRIAGAAVTANSEETADYQYPPVVDGGAASSRFGEVPFALTGNTWLQQVGSAQLLAQFIVNDGAVPRPDLVGVDIVPDPRLQLADRVLIVDSDRSGVNEYARIFGWQIDYQAADGGASYTMTVDARTVAAPSGWILGATGRTELSTTTYSY